MTYIGSGLLIPLEEHVFKLLEEKDNLEAQLYKSKDSYREFRTNHVHFTEPFEGEAFLSVIYLNGKVI
jgi:hypothetical protein